MRGKAIDTANQSPLMSPETCLSIGPQFDRGGRFSGDRVSLPPRSILHAWRDGTTVLVDAAPVTQAGRAIVPSARVDFAKPFAHMHQTYQNRFSRACELHIRRRINLALTARLQYRFSRN